MARPGKARFTEDSFEELYGDEEFDVEQFIGHMEEHGKRRKRRRKAPSARHRIEELLNERELARSIAEAFDDIDESL